MANVFALIAVLGTAVVYGTDVFCALVQRPALAHVDDRALVAVMGNVHRYGDRRMPIPGVIGIAAAAVSAVFAAASGRWAQAVAAGVAVGLLVLWLALYLSVSAPINRRLTAAAGQPDPPVNARALQHNWDRVITIRAVLQGLAITALCAALLT
jgi:ascorbate-specific PTS system EIIC-type component UlaA